MFVLAALRHCNDIASQNPDVENITLLAAAATQHNDVAANPACAALLFGDQPLADGPFCFLEQEEGGRMGKWDCLAKTSAR